MLHRRPTARALAAIFTSAVSVSAAPGCAGDVTAPTAPDAITDSHGDGEPAVEPPPGPCADDSECAELEGGPCRPGQCIAGTCVAVVLQPGAKCVPQDPCWVSGVCVGDTCEPAGPAPPTCGERECGVDRCGRPCGACPPGRACAASGRCVAEQIGCGPIPDSGCCDGAFVASRCVEGMVQSVSCAALGVELGVALRCGWLPDEQAYGCSADSVADPAGQPWACEGAPCEERCGALECGWRCGELCGSCAGDTFCEDGACAPKRGSPPEP